MKTIVGTSNTVQGSNPTLRDTRRDVTVEGRVVPEFLPPKENVMRGKLLCFLSSF